MKLKYQSISVLFTLLYLLDCSISQLVYNNIFWFHNSQKVGNFLPAFLKSPFSSRRNKSETAIRFFLNTKYNPETREELYINEIESIENSHYIPKAPVKILIHGFSATSLDSFPVELIRNFLIKSGEDEDLNLISVDWTDLAVSPWYDLAGKWAFRVGQLTAEFVQFLQKKGLAGHDVHLIGFSLGAHAVGVAGDYYGKMSGKKFYRCTGLDPALPLFGDGSIYGDEKYRIDPTDCQFVDVIHAAGGTLMQGGQAFMEPRGHVDFYPNSGKKQPGCGGMGDLFGGCSHQRAHEYFSESIEDQSAFSSCKCNNWEEFKNGDCECLEKSPMGYNASRSSRGKFYCRTGDSYPYRLIIDS